MLGLDSRAARYTWTAAVVLLVLYVLYLLRGTLFLFVVALLFAYLLYPLVKLLDRYIPSRSRGPALAIVYLLLIGILVVVGIEFGTQAADQAAALSQRAPEFLQKLRQQPPTGGLPHNVQTFQQTAITTLENYLYKHYSDFMGLLPHVTLQVLKASTDLIYLIIVPILSFFLLKDGLTMRDELVSLVDAGRSRELMEEVLGDVHLLLLQYMRALFTLCTITLITFATVLSLMGVPYALLLAAVAFPLEFIPLIGPLIAAISIIGVSAFAGYPHVLWGGNLPGCVPALPGLCDFSAADELGRGVASFACDPGRIRGSGTGGRAGIVSLGADAGADASGVPADPFVAAFEQRTRAGAVIRAVALLLWAAPVWAHVMSMSSGDATVTGSHLEYILRMPLYEVAHTRQPETALFQHIRFSSSGRAGRMVNGECHTDAAHDTYLCGAYYEFGAPVERLDVDCTFYEVTVPNHVHLLRAEKNGNNDQAVFDYTFTHAELRFRPPTAFETAVRQGAAGGMRAVGGLVQVLFLIGLALAARNGRELVALGAMFFAGQIAGALIDWRPAPRFVDLAGAVTLAYLATEMIWLPQAGYRWFVAGCLGVFHGLYFGLFLRDSQYSAKWVLGGAGLVEALLLTVCGAVLLRVRWGRFRWVPGGLLLAAAGFLFVRGYTAFH